jgi:proteasome inhibitor subunit 1 (PI31)
VHAYVLAQGYKLVATGSEAENPATDFASIEDREEVDSSGWDSLPGSVYAFRYQDAESKRAPLFLKCIAAGPKLLVQWLAGSNGSGQTQVVELDLNKFTTEAAAAPAAYQNTEDLMKTLDTGLGKAVSADGFSNANKQLEQTTRRDAYQGREQGEPGPSNRAEHGEGYISPLQEGPPYYPGGGGNREILPPGIMPASVGYEDVVPPGFRPPGYGGIGGSGVGGIPAGPPHMGGGMHVGPGHPVFGAGRLGGGVGGGVGMPPDHSDGTLPPGARWDPIAPPGQRGFRPDDYQQQRRDPAHPHPDMMQPGPGKGTDWDQFYG